MRLWRPFGLLTRLFSSIFSPCSVPSTSSEVTLGPHSGGWKGLGLLLKVLDRSAGAFGPIKSVVTELIRCIEIYERAAIGRDEYDALRRELEQVFQDLQTHFSHDVPPTMTASIESLCRSIHQEVAFLRRKQQDSPLIRAVKEDDSEEVLACYRRIRAHLQRLSLNANLSMWRVIDEQATAAREGRMSARLDRLCPSLSACYNSAESAKVKRGPCTPRTRVNVLEQIHKWIHDPTGPIYWLNGMAGTGKTTLAYSLCAELDDIHALGASFFCSRLLPECRDIKHIVPTISYQLARFSQPFRSALDRVLEEKPDVHMLLPHIQFEALIVQPLVQVRQTLPQDLVVVIDALDECEEKESMQRILEIFLTRATDLPIKFFVSSRPEPEIRDQMMRLNRGLVLHELDEKVVQADIETYLRSALSSVELSEAEIMALMQRAGILFIYAATVVRYIGYGNFCDARGRLESVLAVSSSSDGNIHREIDTLYKSILESALGDPELGQEEKTVMKEVLDTVICAREPLSVGALCGLLCLKRIDQVRAALRPLWSVLHVVGTTELAIVTPLHSSFSDFLFDSERSGDFYCNAPVHNGLLAEKCFQCIKRVRPGFNLCGLPSSHLPDDRVPGIEDMVQRAVSIELFYACRYWATHLEVSEWSTHLAQLLEEFLSIRLLLWMEVLNLKKSVHAGARVMQKAEDWSKRHGCPIELVHDAWRFVTTFASGAVSKSTPHIYVSMLPFWPPSSPVSQCYLPRTDGMIQPQGTAFTRQRISLLATWALGGQVASAAFSPDGTSIVLAIKDKIHVLDAFTGRPALGPLKGHKERVTSVRFSHDNTQIVSGSDDNTICTWDARSGMMILGPLRGHTDWVRSVAFSFHSGHIVSGSDDCTVRLWNSQNGEMVKLFVGHTGYVTSVGFSPCDSIVVSGSDDCTVCVWNVRTGQELYKPLEGHTGQVTSVEFLSDGTRIVSGSDDCAIYVWDAVHGRMIFGPLNGHTQRVTSVRFSPDGGQIVSSSDDKTICVWNAQNGCKILGPLEGHTDSVTTIGFSRDGTRIVSGSDDSTICLWDARSGQISLEALHGHSGGVTSVGFSRDSRRIVSGSTDNTVCVWDAQTGLPALEPLRGHTDHVTSVGLSSDGSRIVSGSADNSVRVWSAQTGQATLPPLQGHTNSVTSVAFSPKGTRIVSGSHDSTLRVWDSATGQLVLGPLQGHTNSVTSVAFSHNGTRIVSGSADNTLRVWGTRKGRMLLGPLEGHTHHVTSVAFSTDGLRIVSGSADNGICVWDARNGHLSLGPLRGHKSAVRSVGFSPGNGRIVSGSDDKTICVHDSCSGMLVFGPICGHTSSITSIAISRDGTRVVSGSQDKSIRVWNLPRTDIPSLQSPSRIRPPWKMNQDGWIVDSRSRLITWVPPDLRSVLVWPSAILHIAADGYVRLGFGGARIGESWVGCYQAS